MQLALCARETRDDDELVFDRVFGDVHDLFGRRTATPGGRGNRGQLAALARAVPALCAPYADARAPCAAHRRAGG